MYAEWAVALGLLIGIIIIARSGRNSRETEKGDALSDGESLTVPANDEPETAHSAAEREQEGLEEQVAESDSEPAEQSFAAEEKPDVEGEQPEIPAEPLSEPERVTAEEQPETESAATDEPQDADTGDEDENESAESYEEEEIEELAATDAAGKTVYYRYNFSFWAKLIQAPAEIQSRYGEIENEIAAYGKLKAARSWRQERIYKGRRTLALLLFKGRKLCIAFALDPKDYADTKYRGKDLSAVKRFEKTPLLLKLTSERKMKYAKYLLSVLTDRLDLTREPKDAVTFSLPYQTTEELIAENLVKVLTSDGRLADGVKYEKADIAALIRSKITLQEAQTLITDAVASQMLEADDDAEPETESGTPVEEPKTPCEQIYISQVPRRTRKAVNIDTLSKMYAPNETVTLETLKEKGLVPEKCRAVKILARGTLDKPLRVQVQDYSLDAVKMIYLTGGQAKRVSCASETDAQ